MKVIEPKWLKEGGYIPKFTPGGTIDQWYIDRYLQNAGLGGWSSNLDSSHAGSTIVGQGNSSLHGHAGDLNTAWEANSTYTGNSARVGQDIQAWYDKWIQEHPDATPQQMVDAYNQLAQSIRTYQSTGHQYGETGATANNRAFRDMFSSRSFKPNEADDLSSDKAFIGYQDRLEDKYGSSTFLRRMDQYEKEYNDLTDEEKLGRVHTVKMGNKDVQVYKKANGDIGLLEQPPTIPGKTPETNLDIDGDTPKYVPIEYTKKYPYRRQTFTDWIPTTLNAIGDVLTAGWNREEDLKKRFPLFEGPHRQSKVTNGYVAREQQQQQINNLQNQAQQQMGSNLNKNKEIIKTYNDYAQNAVNQMAQIRANEFARTTDIANQTSNWNNEQGVQVRNLNNKSNAAAMNNIVLANQKYNTSMNTALQIAGDKLYNDTTKYWLQESQNKAVHDYLNAKIDIENKRNKAYTDYLNIQDNPYSSAEYSAWKQSFNNPSVSLEGVDRDSDGRIKESWFRDNWSTHESASQYRDAWQRAVEKAGMDYARKSRDLDNQLLTAQNSAPQYFIGSLVPYYRNWGSKSQISPEFAKQGTKIVSKKRDNSVRMAEYHRKWQKQENEKMLRAQKMSLEAMNKELDRLNKEQLVLLNAIFK